MFMRILRPTHVAHGEFISRCCEADIAEPAFEDADFNAHETAATSYAVLFDGAEGDLSEPVAWAGWRYGTNIHGQASCKYVDNYVRREYRDPSGSTPFLSDSFCGLYDLVFMRRDIEVVRIEGWFGRYETFLYAGPAVDLHRHFGWHLDSSVEGSGIRANGKIWHRLWAIHHGAGRRQA